MNSTLTREQEAVAFYLIESGDEVARDQFVYLNQRLVGAVARRYRKLGLTWEELLSAGNVGLMIAITKFDYRRGLKFSTCAVPWIKGEITAAFEAKSGQNNSDKRICQTEYGVPLVIKEVEESDGCVVEASSIEEVEESDPLHPNLQDDATFEDHFDLKEAVALDSESDGGLGLTPQQARSEGIGSVAGCADFGNLRGDDSPTDPSPGMGGQAINFAADRKTGVMGIDADLIPALEDAVKRLADPRQAEVITLHFGLFGKEPHTLKQIGASLDISLQRVHAIQKAAYTRLREEPALEFLFEGMTT
jgi:RNA polymerase sigma factor (sigma-70 family)